VIRASGVTHHPVITACLACAAACGGSAYLDSAGKFAKTTSENVSALRSITPLRADLCHRTARYEYAVHRGGGPLTAGDNGKPITVLTYEEAFTGAGAAWSVLCTKANAAEDELFDKTLVALDSYADALATVTSTDFEGTDLAGLGSDAAAVLTKLDQAKAAALTTAAVEPINALATPLKKRYAAKQVAAVVKDSSPAVTKLLEFDDNYLRALATQSKEARDSLKTAVGVADKSTPEANIMASIEVASRWSDDLDHIDAAIAAATDSLTKLRAAQDKLLAANGDKKAPELKTLIGDLSQVLGDIAAIRDALNGKGN
jgi:hypothetical protein